MLSETVATDFHPWEADDEDKSAKSNFSQKSYASTLLNGEDVIIPSPLKENNFMPTILCLRALWSTFLDQALWTERTKRL